MNINTWTSATSSTQNWYSQEYQLEVDGGDNSIYSQYESYITHGKLESHGQAATSSANNFQQSSTTAVSQELRLYMSNKDSNRVASNNRKFPFDFTLASPSTKLQFSLYGKDARVGTA